MDFIRSQYQRGKRKMVKIEQKIDIIIVGTGAAGLYCALQFPEDKNI